MIAAAAEIGELLAGSPYQAYSYAYPHKTAYRPITPPQSLADVWREERRDALFLYIHLPFCEFRCGFCNLFTLAQPAAELPGQYLTTLRRQAAASRAALPGAKFVRLALGGGTPTFLSERELEGLFQIVAETLETDPRGLGASCEASPATITAGKLALLREHGVTRLSLGIQSFHEADAHAMGRPQRATEVEAALDLLQQARFPVLNLDLIYGGETQTVRSWLDSVERAIAVGAAEIYLYPLYVRPLTGLSRLDHQWDDWRLLLYREARDLLLARGYEQVSMRMFRLANSAAEEGPVYCCQDDGMLGLGCGARSYTRSLHYSREYAVGTRAIAGILADYLASSTADFGQAHYGIALNHDERRRRVLILSLLQCEGLPRAFYRQRFATDVLADFPELASLEEAGLAEIDADCIRLTAAGIERSDAIGPWLYSAAVRAKMEAYAWR